MAEFLEDHIEFNGCFPDFATYESGDKRSVVDFGLLSSKIEIVPISWKKVLPDGYGITSPHRALVGSIAVNSTTLITKAAIKWDQTRSDSVAGKVMKILDERYDNIVMAEDFVGIVRCCYIVYLNKVLLPHSNKVTSYDALGAESFVIV